MYKVVLHSVIWIGVWIIIMLMGGNPRGETLNISRFFPFTFNFLILVAFFYFNTEVLVKKFLRHKKYFLYALSLIAFLLLFLIFHRFVFDHFVYSRMRQMPDVVFPPRDAMAPLAGPIHPMRIGMPLMQFIIFFILSTCYWVSTEWFLAIQKNKEIEVEKTNMELAYLKAQINPHFFFNTLNTIYSLSLRKNENAPDAILLFSQMIRYVLDKIDLKTVLLKEEVNYINDYITLQKMRFTDLLTVNFNITGDVSKHNVAPLIFIQFIENAFQYGVSAHYASVIDIELNVSEADIELNVMNKKYKSSQKQTEETKSIGIKNTLRRLNLMYPDSHHLTINETDEQYHINLLITGKQHIQQK